MITGATSLSSWIVFSDAVRYVTSIAAFAIFAYPCSSQCCGETITGVVYSNHHGPSSDAAGMLHVAVGGKVVRIYYGAPALNSGAPPICYDIGAVWSVATRRENDNRVMIGYATCSGKIDRAVHDAWLALRAYIVTRKNPSPSLFSPQWRASPQFTAFIAKGKRINVSSTTRVYRNGECIDVLGQRRDTLRLRAGMDCYLTVDGRPIELQVHIKSNPDGSGPQIDEGAIWPIGPNYR